MSCTRGTLKQIVSSYKSHLRSATANGDNAKIVDPFLCLNIACPPGSYDANVEPAKDDVLFVNSELLLGLVERWFHSIYGEVQPSSFKPSVKAVSALKSRGIELLLAQKEAPVESPPVIGSPLPALRSASKLTTHTQSSSNSLVNPAFDSSAEAPPYQNSEETPGPISHSFKEILATDKAQTEELPDLLPDHDFSTPMLSEDTGLGSSGDAVSPHGKPVWEGSMYEYAEEEGFGLHLQGRARSPVDLDLDGGEHMRDVNVSNPWAFAKLNATMRPSGRSKQLHTPGRQPGDVGHSTDRSSDDLPQHADPPLREKHLPRVHQARSSPEAAYGTPSPFPFPQKARGKRKTADASVDVLITPAPSNKERHKRGALDTWVQKSLGGYDEADDSPNTFQKDQGPPDLPYPGDFVSARSLPPGGTPLSEIPDATQRTRRKPAPRKQQQGDIDKPFISPVNDPHRVWFDTGENPSRKRPQRPRPTMDHQDPTTAPSLILRDEETEDDESMISTSTERSLPPMHPDLAITLDYEARKQRASEAYRKVLREQAAAAAAKLASGASADVPDPLSPQHATASPHKNRQAKAIAALHTSDIPPPPATPSLGVPESAALEPSDPRAYLLRIHRQGDQAPEPLRGKSKRHKTAMLPLETLKEEDYIGGLTLVVADVNVGDVEGAMQDSGACDHYVEKGEVGAAFENAGADQIKQWEDTLRDVVRGMYAVEGGGEGEGEGEERADVEVDMSRIVPARAAGSSA
ncbi:MAG: hypothetical protein Q9161_008268 [Pseudevernia consocians]